jgi:hypothetical protein
MSNNRLKFTLGIIATTGVVALSSVANAESAKSSAVGNILNRANLTIALSQSKKPTNQPTSVTAPNSGKVPLKNININLSEKAGSASILQNISGNTRRSNVQGCIDFFCAGAPSAQGCIDGGCG